MCKYCEVKKSEYKWRKDLVGEKMCETEYEYTKIVQRDDKQFYIYVCGDFEDYSEAISFCPFCGKKLK
jgi:hypothetical protein